MSDLEESLRQVVREAVQEAVGDALEDADVPSGENPEPSWRERLWTCPSSARLGLPEVVEALGRSESWVYSRTRAAAEDPLPHAKLSGSLVFRAGELRHWIREHEDVQVAGPSDPPEGTIRLDGEAA